MQGVLCFNDLAIMANPDEDLEDVNDSAPVHELVMSMKHILDEFNDNRHPSIDQINYAKSQLQAKFDDVINKNIKDFDSEYYLFIDGIYTVNIDKNNAKVIEEITEEEAVRIRYATDHYFNSLRNMCPDQYDYNLITEVLFIVVIDIIVKGRPIAIVYPNGYNAEDQSLARLGWAVNPDNDLGYEQGEDMWDDDDWDDEDEDDDE